MAGDVDVRRRDRELLGDLLGPDLRVGGEGVVVAQRADALADAVVQLVEAPADGVPVLVKDVAAPKILSWAGGGLRRLLVTDPEVAVERRWADAELFADLGHGVLLLAHRARGDRCSGVIAAGRHPSGRGHASQPARESAVADQFPLWACSLPYADESPRCVRCHSRCSYSPRTEAGNSGKAGRLTDRHLSIVTLTHGAER